MPTQTIDTAAPSQTKSSKGFLGFMKARTGSSRRSTEQSSIWALGDTWSSNTRRSARRPVWE